VLTGHVCICKFEIMISRSQIRKLWTNIVSGVHCIGERPYLTTKIITLSEFFNFVHQVSRL
jgi:hypothetical protein